MTQVTFYKRSDGMYTGFTAKGHAGYAKYGKDILCAAISALVESTANGITEVVGAKTDLLAIDEGYVDIEIAETESDAIFQSAQILIETLYRALASIAEEKQYSGHIRITTTERRKKHV